MICPPAGCQHLLSRKYGQILTFEDVVRTPELKGKTGGQGQLMALRAVGRIIIVDDNWCCRSSKRETSSETSWRTRRVEEAALIGSHSERARNQRGERYNHVEARRCQSGRWSQTKKLKVIRKGLAQPRRACEWRRHRSGAGLTREERVKHDGCQQSGLMVRSARKA